MTNEEAVKQLMENAKQALKEMEKLSQELIDNMCKQLCIAMREHAEELAKEAVEETGLGNVPDKIGKNSGTPSGVWYAVKGKKSRGIIGHDEKHHLTYVAHPKGVISCVIPTTNPNMTVFVNGVYAIKGANVMIFAPHPRAKKSTVHTCDIFQKVVKECGGPDNVFQYVTEPNMELTQMMMHASDTVLGTGGPGMVKAAYSSGKPAYGVGAGNSQMIIDEDYDDLEGAVDKLIFGNTLDNGIICACSRSIITPKSVSAKVVDIMKSKNIYYIDDPETRDHIRDVIFPNGFGKLNGDIVGQDVDVVADMLGITIPEGTKTICVKIDKVGLDEPLSREKMLPLFVHIDCEDFKDGVQKAKANLLAEGAGHSSVVMSHNKELIEYAAVELPVSRLLVNQAGPGSANAFLNNGLVPTSTLGCGSWSGCSISENLTYKHLINISRIAYLYPEDEVPTEDGIWNGDAAF